MSASNNNQNGSQSHPPPQLHVCSHACFDCPHYHEKQRQLKVTLPNQPIGKFAIQKPAHRQQLTRYALLIAICVVMVINAGVTINKVFAARESGESVKVEEISKRQDQFDAQNVIGRLAALEKFSETMAKSQDEEKKDRKEFEAKVEGWAEKLVYSVIGLLVAIVLTFITWVVNKFTVGFELVKPGRAK